MSQSNTTLTEQEAGWINECAGRLRLIQADAATVAPEKRREYLQEEVAHSLKNLPPANRKRYLEALLARFPVAGQTLKTDPAAAAPAPPPKPESVDETLQRFITAASTVPEEKRVEFSRRLAEGGFVGVDRDSLVLEMSDELRRRLNLQGDQQPHLKRVVELAVFLVEALTQLDRQALKTMHELAPRSGLIKRSEDFRSAAARFLVGETESIEPQWQPIRSLLGALLVAVQGGGKTFGKDYFLTRFSPGAIEDVVHSEGDFGRFMGPSKKERCWEKYKDLAEDFATPDMINQRIKDCLAVVVEKTAALEKTAAGGR